MRKGEKRRSVRGSLDLGNRWRRVSHRLFERRPFEDRFYHRCFALMDPRYGEAPSVSISLASLEVWKLGVCSKVDRGWEDLGR